MKNFIMFVFAMISASIVAIALGVECAFTGESIPDALVRAENGIKRIIKRIESM